MPARLWPFLLVLREQAVVQHVCAPFRSWLGIVRHCTKLAHLRLRSCRGRVWRRRYLDRKYSHLGRLCADAGETEGYGTDCFVPIDRLHEWASPERRIDWVVVDMAVLLLDQSSYVTTAVTTSVSIAI